MTIALILAGHKYKVTPAAAGFAYQTDGQALSVGQTFTASQGAMFNDALKLGMMRGHIVELFDQSLVADRDARLTELRTAMGQYASSHSGQGAASILLYDTVQTAELRDDDDVLYGIVVTQPIEGATTLAGTTLDKTSPAVFQAVKNGSNVGTAVSATGAGPLFAISRNALVALVAGDVAGFFAKDSADSSRLSDTVSSTVKFAAPTITGTPVQGATSVTGTTGAATPDDATVTLYQNGTSIKTATVASSAWTASSIGAGILVGTGSLTAKIGAGLLTESAASTAVVVKFNAPVITDNTYDEGDTSITGTSDAPDGTTITVYRGGSTSMGTTTVTGGVWTKTALTLVGNYSLTAKAGLTTAQSVASAAVVVHYNAPAMGGTITALSDQANGTTSPAAANGVAINVYHDAVHVETGAVAGGAGAFSVNPVSYTVGQSITVTAGAFGGASESAVSNAIVVQYETPVLGAIAATEVADGTSVAAGGTLVTVYKQALGVGSFDPITPTGTVAANAFSITPDVAFVATDVVKVKIGAAGASQSAFSNAVTVSV